MLGQYIIDADGRRASLGADPSPMSTESSFALWAILLGVVGLAGFFAYKNYQDEQKLTPKERVALRLQQQEANNKTMLYGAGASFLGNLGRD